MTTKRASQMVSLLNFKLYFLNILQSKIHTITSNVYLLDPNWILLFTNTHIIFSLSGSGNNFTNLAPPKKIMTCENQASSIQCLTSDVKSNVIYWTNGADNQKRVTKMNLENNTRSNLAYSGLHSPNGIAFDWITSNVYFLDTQMSCIVVCSTRSDNCATVVQEPLNQINQPIDIALHPNEG